MAFAVTAPDTLEMIVGELLNLSVDFTGLIGSSAGTIYNPVVSIVNASTDEAVPNAIIGEVTSVGQVIFATISSAPLRASTSYTATFSCVAFNTGVFTFNVAIAGLNTTVVPSNLITWSGGESLAVSLVIEVIY